MTKEDVKPDTPNWEVYAASKTLAEQAAWDFAESHPELDLTTSQSLIFCSPTTSHLLLTSPPAFHLWASRASPRSVRPIRPQHQQVALPANRQANRDICRSHFTTRRRCSRCRNSRCARSFRTGAAPRRGKAKAARPCPWRIVHLDGRCEAPRSCAPGAERSTCRGWESEC